MTYVDICTVPGPVIRVDNQKTISYFNKNEKDEFLRRSKEGYEIILIVKLREDKWKKTHIVFLMGKPG